MLFFLHCLKLRSLPEDLSGVALLGGTAPRHRNVVSSAPDSYSVVKVFAKHFGLDSVIILSRYVYVKGLGENN